VIALGGDFTGSGAAIDRRWKVLERLLERVAHVVRAVKQQREFTLSLEGDSTGAVHSARDVAVGGIDGVYALLH
jgi:hypothetical protein